MKYFFFLIAMLFVITADAQKNAQTNSDTIEIRGSGFYLNGKAILPYSKSSVLKNFPESNLEYLLARKHRTKAWRFIGAGAIMFLSTALYRNTDADGPIMIAGGVVASLALFQIPKMRRHMKRSISLYNQEVIKRQEKEE
jgi:hypothetical protein